MLLKILVFCLAFPFFLETAQAKDKYLYVMGGAGDPPGDGTTFDREIEQIGVFSHSPEWKTTIAFDGGHSETEGLVRKEFRNSKRLGDLTFSTFVQMIQDMKKKLSELGEGDQLMLIIDDHGLERGGGENSHRINVGDESAYSLDDLTEVISLAKKRKVKLAIVDESCFSGNTLALANGSNCIISGTGMHQFSYVRGTGFHSWFAERPFVEKFNNLLEPGRNLEDIFLSARRDGTRPEFPMISTPAGAEIQKKLDELITPYLYHYGYRDFSLYYSLDYPSTDRCKIAENDFSDLQAFLNGVQRSVGNSNLNQQIDGLKRALEKYHDFQLQYVRVAEAAKATSDQVESILARDYPAQKSLFSGETGMDILNADYDKKISLCEKFGNEVPQDKSLWEARAASLREQKRVAGEIRDKLPAASKQNLAEYGTFLKRWGETFGLASGVSRELRKVYDGLYREQMASEGNNPCRDFVL